jgi:glycosyltransferase involved in cell wall biosynthesis
MHIVHYLCTARVVDGGVPKAAVDLSLRVGAAGHRVTFLTWDDELCPRSWKDGTDPNVRLVRLTPPKRRLGFFSERQLRAFADAIADADAVHLHAMWTPSNLQVARVARRLGKPYVITPHGMLDLWCMAQSTRNKRLFLLLAGNALLRHAAFVHFTAQSELDQARGLLPRGRTRVLPLVFDTEPYLKLPGRHLAAERFNLEEGGPIRLLFLSRIHPKKGLERLLGATRRLLESGQNVRLLIAGSGDPGYEAQIRALTGQLGLTDKVRFLGPVTGEVKVSLYQLADLFVLPTSQENFGFVFFEALAAGTPIVTTRAVDTWRELESSTAATIFELPSAGGLEAEVATTTDAIRGAIATRDRLRESGQAGRAWVLDAMSPERITAGFVEMYREASGR